MIKTKTIKTVRRKKVKVPVETRKSLKDLLEYEISETYEWNKVTHKINKKIDLIEQELDKTISVGERKLIDKLIELMGEAEYHYHQYFYKTLWKMLKDWDA